MAEYLIQDKSLTAIADGFRTSRGTTTKYTLDEMALLAAERGVDTSEDTVSADNLLEGVTAHNSDGEQITGTIPIIQNSAGFIMNKNQRYRIDPGYYNGTSYVSILSSEVEELIPENIKEGISILGVWGTCGGFKIATGSFTLASSIGGRSVTAATISGLDFTPSVVYVTSEAMQISGNQYSGIYLLSMVSTGGISFCAFASTARCGVGQGYGSISIMDKGFSVIVGSGTLLTAGNTARMRAGTYHYIVIK